MATSRALSSRVRRWAIGAIAVAVESASGCGGCAAIIGERDRRGGAGFGSERAPNSALRVSRGIEGCWHRLGSLCHEDAAGFEVAWVGEPVGGAPEHLEQVVGALDSAVGGAAGTVPVEDLVGPCDERVDGVVVLGQLAVLVEVAEPPEGFEGAVIVVGGVEAVELLEGLPAGFEAGVGVEQLVEAGAVGVGEGVASCAAA